MKTPRPPNKRLIAVIDIGSNSVRLVVFQGLRRTPGVIFNERVLCGLGAGIESHGKMTGPARDKALAALERFAVLCADMKVDEIDAMATAAVRDASNGAAFVREIKRRCGFPVKVLSGTAEAELSAYGVLSGFPGANGLAADLGGGSLELIHLTDGEIRDKVSLPIGPVRLMNKTAIFTKAHIKMVRAAISGVDWLEQYRGQPLYLVGGAWRALCHLHIVQTGWPLHVLHGYEMTGGAASSFARLIEKQSIESLKGVASIPYRRLITLPASARILREIIRRAAPARVITSAYGIREGLIYRKLDEAVQRQDPLIASARRLGKKTARFPKHGEVLFRWLAPLYKEEKPAAARLREAVCHMSEISLSAHPDFKAEMAFSRSLVGGYVGVTHAERAYIALALFISYGGALSDPVIRPALRILSESETSAAVALGLAVRVAQKLTGGTARPLKKTRIFKTRKRVILELRAEDRVLYGKSVARRLGVLADHLGLKPKMKLRKL